MAPSPRCVQYHTHTHTHTQHCTTTASGKHGFVCPASQGKALEVNPLDLKEGSELAALLARDGVKPAFEISDAVKPSCQPTHSPVVKSDGKAQGTQGTLDKHMQPGPGYAGSPMLPMDLGADMTKLAGGKRGCNRQTSQQPPVVPATSNGKEPGGKEKPVATTTPAATATTRENKRSTQRDELG